MQIQLIHFDKHFLFLCYNYQIDIILLFSSIYFKNCFLNSSQILSQGWKHPHSTMWLFFLLHGVGCTSSHPECSSTFFDLSDGSKLLNQHVSLFVVIGLYAGMLTTLPLFFTSMHKRVASYLLHYQ